MKFKLKKNCNDVLGATLECSVVETLIIIRALKTEMLANKTLYKGLRREKDNRLIEKMIEKMREEMEAE